MNRLSAIKPRYGWCDTSPESTFNDDIFAPILSSEFPVLLFMATTTDSTGSEHHRAQAAASVVKSALLDIVILTEDATNPDLGGWSTEMVTKLRQNVVRL